ncbi:MAG: hypothetical protein HQK54_17300 [Oligoflexales bacterium]|nr:hypothetical protein [Oligoflexales bacterium]
MTYRLMLRLALVLFVLSASPSRAQNQAPEEPPPPPEPPPPREDPVPDEAPRNSGSPSTINREPKENKLEKDPRKTWKPDAQKKFDAKTKKNECLKYEGKYIGYYDRIYYVQKCRRREILNQDLTSEITAKGYKVIPVTNDTIVMLEEGAELIDPNNTNKKLIPRNCRELNNKYVMDIGGDIYLMDNCTLRMFPDWETFEDHKKKSKINVPRIFELTSEEQKIFKKGRDMPSILPEAFKKILEIGKEVDVIPLKEACKGVDGKYVSYYSRLYKIEKCRKREIDAPEFLKNRDNQKIKFTELTSEQWISLPTGKPLLPPKED